MKEKSSRKEMQRFPGERHDMALQPGELEGGRTLRTLRRI